MAMVARKFRILYHNVDQGVFCTGSLLDEETNAKFNYVYIGASQEYIPTSPSAGITFNYYEDIDLLVLADFNISHIKRMIALIKMAKVRVVVYPYMAPVQRQVVLQEALAAAEEDEDLKTFLNDPYRFFKSQQIIFVYPLMGNGPQYEPSEEENYHCFELVNEEELKFATELEGYFQPIVRAGYMAEKNWLMFMGCYGLDLKTVRDFSVAAEAENRILNEGKMDCVKTERQMAFSYLSKFGRSSFGTIVLYSSLLNEGPSVDDCMLMVKTMGSSKMCNPVLTPESELCSAYCMYKGDHDYCKHHNQISMSHHIQGTLLLGNLNINKYCKEFSDRFSSISKYIRFYAIPNNGNIENWDNMLTDWSVKGHRKYWIGNSMSDARVIKDIVSADPNNRFMTYDGVSGVCIYGFYTKLNKERQQNKSNERQL